VNPRIRDRFIAQSSPGPARGRSVLAAFLAVTVVVSGACGQEPLTADSKCSEYIERPSDERHDAAVRISSQTEGVSSPGNPMWGFSLDGACGSSPDLTLGEYFR